MAAVLRAVEEDEYIPCDKCGVAVAVTQYNCNQVASRHFFDSVRRCFSRPHSTPALCLTTIEFPLSFM